MARRSENGPERSASIFRRIVPADAMNSRSLARLRDHFGHDRGVDYTIDVTRTARYANRARLALAAHRIVT